MVEPAVVFAWSATVLVFAPLLAALAVYVLPDGRLRRALPLLVAVGLPVVLLSMSTLLLREGTQRFAFGGHDAPLGIELAIDGLAIAMLWMTATVNLAVTCYLPVWSRGQPGFRLHEFQSVFLLLWTGLNALYLSADLFNIYVTLEIVTICAVSLVVFAHGAAVVRAAMRYLLFAIAGSILYLLGVALVYAHTGLLVISDVLPVFEQHGIALAALAFMTGGLAIKAALFPVHGWLPPAHASAPGPASAVLSALVAKAGAYLILRLWLGPFAEVTTVALHQVLALLGVAGMLYASVQALVQPRLKGVIAYSTVAQLGYLLLLPALGSLLAWQGMIYHGVVHGLAKAALFLAAANLIRIMGSDRLGNLAGSDRVAGGSLMAIALAGVSLAGLPPSGGFIGKWWLVSAALESGQWWWAVAIGGGGLLAAAYILRVLHYALVMPEGGGFRPATQTPVGRGMVWPPVFLAATAMALGLTGDLLAPLIGVGAPWAGGS